MTKRNPDFDTILNDVPAHSSSAKPEKPLLVNVPITKELKLLLDRVIHHKGKTTNQKLWLAEVVKKAIEADPDSLKPVPGEK